MLGACAPPPPAPAEAPAGDARAAVGAANAGPGSSASEGATSHRGATPDAGGAGEAEAPPLVADTPWVELELKGFAPAVVSLPLGARGPRPVVLVTHGAGDNPAWQCEWWRGLVRDRAFLLCPRGIAAGRLPSGNMGYAYASEPALEREALAALAALAARYAPYVDEKGLVYAGFSQGASFGVPLLARNAERFRAAILLEDGFQPSAWTTTRARALGRGGLGRVLFGCGRAGCARGAREAARRLEGAGLETRVFHAEGAGHSYAGTGVERETFAAFAWVIEGDARWGEAAGGRLTKGRR